MHACLRMHIRSKVHFVTVKITNRNMTDSSEMVANLDMTRLAMSGSSCLRALPLGPVIQQNNGCKNKEAATIVYG